MSKSRIIVLSVVQKVLTRAGVARKYGVSWRWTHTLVTHPEHAGLEALEPSRRPKSNPREITPALTARIITLREELSAAGLDAGPGSIRFYLDNEGNSTPAESTISRTLNRAGLEIPEPRKRPKSSCIHFQADLPNETWQSDFNHLAPRRGNRC